MDDVMLFRHMVVDNRAERTLFLLHGTGGNEQDFLFLNEILGASYNLIGLQGNVNENGMPRFFKRSSIGVFDEENIRVESNKLQRFVLSWMKTQKTIFEHLYFLGYSNGANILLASLFYYPHLFKNLLLLHPMLPFSVTSGSLDLSRHRIFVSMGAHDQMVSRVLQKEVIETLQSCGASVTSKEYRQGHEICDQEIKDAVAFLS